MTNLPPPITNKQSALKNIDTFFADIDNQPEMQRRLSRVRAWYCLKNNDGKFIFAPSKFIGYENITFKTYFEFYNKGLTGGETEHVLKDMFKEMDPEHPSWNDVNQALNEFLMKFGKRRNKISRMHFCGSLDNEARPMGTSAIEVMIAAFEKLIPSQQRIFQSKIADMS